MWSPSECEAETASLAPDERLVMDSLARLLAHIDLFSPDAFYSEGITQLLQRREFSQADPERIRKVVEALEENSILPQIARHALESEGVQVIIGAENETDTLKDMSVIVARYGVRGTIWWPARRRRADAHAVQPRHRGRALHDADAQRPAGRYLGNLGRGGDVYGRQ